MTDSASRAYGHLVELHERIQGWHKHLRPDLDAKQTAALIGVSKTAVLEWWSGNYQPTYKHLAIYAEKVLRMSLAEFWSAVPVAKRTA